MSMMFKWNMFFTSFLPLWTSIIVNDLWTMGIRITEYLSDIAKGLSAVEHIRCFIATVRIEAITFLVLAVHIIVSIQSINKEIQKQENSPNKSVGTVIRAKRANKLSAEFLLAYILPMIAFDFNALDSLSLFLIYFAALSFLCLRNSNVYTNIFLEIKGYKMYECDVECGIANGIYVYTDCLLLSKHNLLQPIPRNVEYFDFENYIYIDIGDSDE